MDYNQIQTSNSWLAKFIKAIAEKKAKEDKWKGMLPDNNVGNAITQIFLPREQQIKNRLRRAEKNIPYMRRGTQVTSTSNYRTVASGAISTNGIIDVTSSAVLKAGSGSPVIAEAGFSYIATGTTITWYWDGTNSSRRIILRRADDTKQVVPKGSMVVSGLSNSTTYYFLPFWSVNAQVLGWVIGTVGSPKIAFTVATSNDAIQQQNLQDREPLTTNFMSATTTAGAPAPPSGGGGGGGADPSCPAVEMYVDESTQAGNCTVGHKLTCLNDLMSDTEQHAIEWMRVARADCIRYRTANGAERIDSESTPVPTLEGDATFALELKPGMHVMTDVGNGLEWSELVEVETVGTRPVVRLFCGGRNFAAGTVPGKVIFSHNNRIAK